MLEKQIEKLRLWLDRWQGSTVSVSNYNGDFERLVLALKRSDGEVVGISLFHPTFLSGPFSWTNCHLVFSYSQMNERGAEFSLTDESAKFTIRFGGPIAVGDGKLVVPSD